MIGIIIIARRRFVNISSGRLAAFSIFDQTGSLPGAIFWRVGACVRRPGACFPVFSLLLDIFARLRYDKKVTKRLQSAAPFGGGEAGSDGGERALPNLFHTFSGGVYPHHRKSATRRKEIQPLPLPDRVTLPLCAPGCEPCQPMVKAGDAVREGQQIGRPPEDGVPVYASLTGRVTAVEERPRVDGTAALSVVIDREGTEGAEPLTLSWPKAPEEMSGKELLEAVRLIGVGNADGGALPLHRRLRAGMGRTELLILNGCESEPLLTADHRVMAEWPGDVISAAKLLMKLLGAQRCVIAVESNKSDAIAALQDRLPLRGGSIRVQALRAMYPQGMDKPLVYSLTGREIPLGGGPLDAGCLVVGVSAAAAVAQGLGQGTPFTHRVMTVAGSNVERPQNIWTPLGVRLEDLLQASGGCKAAPRCCVVGGPMTGREAADLALPAEGDVPGLLALGPREPFLTREHPRCLHCGRCMEVCPMHLLPLYFHLYRGHPGQLKQYHLDYCMQCGTCTYVCPARVPLADRIRQGLALLSGEEDGQ